MIDIAAIDVQWVDRLEVNVGPFFCCGPYRCCCGGNSGGGACRSLLGWFGLGQLHLKPWLRPVWCVQGDGRTLGVLWQLMMCC